MALTNPLSGTYDSDEPITTEQEYRAALRWLAVWKNAQTTGIVMKPEVYTALKDLESITRQQIAEYEHSRHV